MPSGFELAEIVEAMDVALIVAHGDGVEYVNAATERLFGADRASLLGRSLSTLLERNPNEQQERRWEAEVARYDGVVLGVDVKMSALGGGRALIELRPSDPRSAEVGHTNLASVRLRAEVSEAFARFSETDKILRLITDSIVRNLAAAFARVWLVDDDARWLRLHASSGLYTRIDGTHSEIEVGELKIGRIAQTGVPLVTNDVPHDPAISDPEWAASHQIVAFAGYPLVVGTRIVGVVALFARHELAEGVIDALASVADVMAQGVERLRAEAALAASYAEVEAVLSGVNDGVIAVDEGGTVAYTNERAPAMLGARSRAELLNRRWREVFESGEMRDEDGALMDFSDAPSVAALSEWRAREVLLSRRTPQGDMSWFLVRAVPVESATARSRIVIVYRDITSKKRMEDIWRFLATASVSLAATSQLDTILTVASEIVVPRYADLSAVLRIDGETGAVLDTHTYHQDPAIASMAHDFWVRFPPDLASEVNVGAVLRRAEPLLYRDVDVVLARLRDKYPEYVEAIRKLGARSTIFVPLYADGRLFGALAAATISSPHRYDEVDLALFVELGHRLTLAIENAELLQAARDSVSARDTFLSIASHELKTPITTLLLQSESLLRSARAGDTVPAAIVRERAEKLRRQTQRLTTLVNELLDVSRIDYGRLHMSAEEVDLGALVEEVVSRFEDDADPTRSRVTTTIDDPIVGRWDRLRLDEVVTNLVANAIKYGMGNPVEVRVSRRGDECCVAVTDRGIGISEAHQRELFQRFSRFVSDRHYGGFGLGLWISRQIVEALGGTIRVASEIGRGSTFTVMLPISADSSEADAGRDG